MVRYKKVLPTSTWQYKSLAAGYSVLLGLVLPFICWGTLATPGHPHRMAHLVFLMPPILVEMLAQGDMDHTNEYSVNPTTDHSNNHNIAEAEHLQSQVDGEPRASTTQPVGRSVPDELVSAISIITPLLLIQTLLVFSPTRSILRLNYTNRAHLFDPHVLTPPPRPLSV